MFPVAHDLPIVGLKPTVEVHPGTVLVFVFNGVATTFSVTELLNGKADAFSFTATVCAPRLSDAGTTKLKEVGEIKVGVIVCPYAPSRATKVY